MDVDTSKTEYSGLHPQSLLARRTHTNAELETQIKQTEIYLQHLKDQHAKNRDNIFQTQSRRSQDLPPEIWSLVFEFVHGDDVYHIPAPPAGEVTKYHVKRSFPEHVCRRWRRIALNNPALWRGTVVRYTAFANRVDWERARIWEMTDFAATIIQYGTKDLRIDFSCDGHFFNMNDMSASLRLLCWPVRARLERLTVTHEGASPGFVLGLLDLLPNFPCLRAFSEQCESDGEADMTCALSLPVLDAPFLNLSHLSMGHCDGGIYLHPQMAHYLLSLYPNLKGCTITIDSSGDPLKFPLPSDPTNLETKLEKLTKLALTIRVSEVEQAGIALKPFILPSLADFELSVTGLHQDTSFTIPTLFLNELLARSGCNLQSQVINGDFLDANGLIDYLTHTPTLKELVLGTLSCPPAVLTRISTAEILPQLIAFTCVLQGDLEAIEAYQNMAQLRCRGRNGSDMILLVLFYDGYEQELIATLAKECETEGRHCTFLGRGSPELEAFMVAGL